MISHSVIFVVNDQCAVDFVTQPIRWTSFKFQIAEIMKELACLEWWRVVNERKITNRRVNLTAQSVTMKE